MADVAAAETAPATVPEPVKETPKVGDVLSPDIKAKIMGKARGGLAAKAEKPTPAVEAVAPVAPPKAEPPKDDEADRLAMLVREDRRLKAERQSIEAEKKSHGDEIAIARAVREAKAKGDNVAAIKALFPGQDVTETVFWDLVKSIADQPDDAEPDVGALVDQKLAATLAKRDEDAAKAETERVGKALDTARNGYAEACAVELKASGEKFPLVMAYGFTVEEMDKHVRAVRATTGRVPEPAEVLAHFEEVKAKALERTPYKRQIESVPASKPSGTVTSAWTKDSGATSVKPTGVSLDDKTKALKERLRAMARQATG